MEYHQLSASAFADRIQVQRSSISHLLSGRNKPSLDFVMKVVKEFDEVELYWLLNGKGNFPDTSEKSPGSEAIHATDIASRAAMSSGATLQSSDKSLHGTIGEQQEESLGKTQDPAKKIERIVVFYNDGTFKAYLP